MAAYPITLAEGRMAVNEAVFGATFARMVRPLLPETPALPTPPLRDRVRRFLRDTWRGRILLGALAVWLLDVLLGLPGLGVPGLLRIPAKLVGSDRFLSLKRSPK